MKINNGRLIKIVMKTYDDNNIRTIYEYTSRVMNLRRTGCHFITYEMNGINEGRWRWERIRSASFLSLLNFNLHLYCTTSGRCHIKKRRTFKSNAELHVVSGNSYHKTEQLRHPVCFHLGVGNIFELLSWWGDVQLL